MKTKTVMVLIAVLLAVTLSACTGAAAPGSSAAAPGSSPAASNTQAPEKKAVQNLVITTFGSWAQAGTGLDAAIKYLNAKSDQTGISFEVDALPEGDEGDSILKTRFASGQYPDIVYYFNAPLAQKNLGKPDDFADLSGDWTSKYDQTTLTSDIYSMGGKLKAAPIGGMQVGGVFYNKKVFSDLGLTVPKTFDELLSACEKIKAAGKIPFYLSGKDSWTVPLTAIFAFNRELVGKDANDIYNQINTNKLHYADLKLFQEGFGNTKVLKDKGYINDTWLSDTYDMAQKALTSGDAAMYANASWMIASMQETYGQDAVNNIGGFAFPFSDSATVSTWTPNALLVPNNGKNVEAALQGVNLLMSDDAQSEFFKADINVPMRAGLTSTLAPSAQDFYDIYQAGNGYVNFTSATKYGQGSSFGTNIQELLMGSMKAEQVAAMLDEETAAAATAQNDPNWVK